MIKKYPKYITSLFYCIVFFAPLSLLSQNTATIYGVVKDSTNNPLGEVSISILGSSQTPIYSDSNGKYTFVIPAEQEVKIGRAHV